MKSIFTSIRRVIIAKIEPDDELIDSIINLVEVSGIKSGIINCIGAFKEFTLGYFNLGTKVYDYKTFKENVELISCIGNISYKEKAPIIHLHANVGRSDFSVIGGHLTSPCIISVTAEVVIFETDIEIKRKIDEKFNLSLLNLN